jgi:hypothetical protein
MASKVEDLFEVVTPSGAVIFEGTKRQCTAFVKDKAKSALPKAARREKLTIRDLEA